MMAAALDNVGGAHMSALPGHLLEPLRGACRVALYGARLFSYPPASSVLIAPLRGGARTPAGGAVAAPRIPAPIRDLLLIATGIAGLTSLVAAQDAENLPVGMLPLVTVTGSSIPRLNGEEASPLQVLTADDFARSGYTTVWQVLNSITANGQATLSQNFSAAFASGASGISLRGLGVGATLVLIDGHRMAPFPVGDDDQRSFVDIANIPLDAVERIDILKDGASAIYGSDAIAGVVNIVLKRTFAGTRVTADAGTSYRNDGGQARVAVLSGFGDLRRDGYNLFVSGEVRKQNQIKFSDRGGIFEQTDFTSTGGLNVTPGVPNQLNGGLPGSATGYVTDATGKIVGFMPGCDSVRFAAGKCSYSNSWSQIQPRVDNQNLLARYTQRLAGDWEVSVQGSYFETLSQQAHQPATTFTRGYQGITSGPGTVPVLRDPLPPTSIPSTNPSYPAGTGLRSGLLHYTFLDLGSQLFESDSRSSRLIADLQGSLGGWYVSGAMGFTQVLLTQTGHGLVNAANLQMALDSPTAPYIVGGPNSAAVLNFIAPEQSTTQKSRLSFVHVSGNRDLMELQGGSLSVAIGADYVHRTQVERPPADAAAGLIDSFGNDFAIGTQNVASIYAEVLGPITNKLSTEAALRYDHYNISGGKASPKVGFKYLPLPDLTVRGTAGRGFRAPGPAENGNAGLTFSTGGTTDPVLCPNRSNTAAVGTFPSQCRINVGTIIGSNPAVKPETSTSYTFGLIAKAAEGLSASVDFFNIDVKDQIILGNQPTTVRGTNLTPLPQVQPDGTIALVVPPTAPIAYYKLGYVNANKTSTNGFDFGLQYQRRLEGIGHLQSDLMVTYVNKYDLTIDGKTYSIAGTHGLIPVSGDTGSPRAKAQWVTTLASGPWSLTGTVNYISSFSLTDPSIGVTDCVSGLKFGAGASAYINQLGSGVVPAGVNCRVASFTTLDVTGRYAVNQNLVLQVAVLNVLNRSAPLDWGTYGGAGAPFNPSFHSQGAIGRYFTLSATFTF
jgi:iron complex outermembrane receptor protein